MSKTRHASPGAPLSQERYLSSPEYAELRGISGNAVTTKAALMAIPEKRNLLFFLQAMSLKPGGLKEFCRCFLEMFADRIGTPTLRRIGGNNGQPCSPEVTRQVEEEIKPSRRESRLKGDDLRAQARRARLLRYANFFDTGYEDRLRRANEEPACKAQPTERRTFEDLLDECQSCAGELDLFIIDLCINPKVQFNAPGHGNGSVDDERLIMSDAFSGEINDSDFRLASLTWFEDIVGALFEYQRRYEEAARADFVMTEIGRKVFETLDFGLATGKLVVLEGDSRTGKTTSTEAWCNLHLGGARFVSLSGITHKTGLFRALAKVLGIGSGYAKSSTEMQTRIEDLLHRSRLMVVIDEAHHLFSSSERVYSRPELIDWLDTSLYNNGVPVGLVCTPQFTLRMVRAEKQTTWNADQFRGRAKRFVTLPARPTDADIEAIARKLLPNGCADSLRLLTGYAISSKLPLPALIDAMDEAKYLVKREGRQEITFEDLRRAIFDYCAQSAEAMARAFDAQLGKKRPGPRPAPTAPPVRAAAADPPTADGNAPASPMPPRTARKQNLTGLTPKHRNPPVLLVTAPRDSLQPG